MSKSNKSRMIQSEAMNKELDQLESKSGANAKNKKGSTNEIQPMATNGDITQ